MASSDFAGSGIRTAFELNLTVDAPSAWVVADSGNPAHGGGFGQILLQRYHVAMDGVGPAAGTDVSGAGDVDIALLEPRGGIRVANDNVAWITDIDGNPVIGRDPAVAALSTGDTLIAWIGVDGHVHARLYPFSDDFIATPEDDTLDLIQPDHDSVNTLMKDLGEALPAASPLPTAARRLQVTELSPGNFAIMWIALAASGLALQGKLYSFEAGSGDKPSGWSEGKITTVGLSHDFSGAFSVASLGDAGLAVSYEVVDGQSTHLVARIVDDLGVGTLPLGTSNFPDSPHEPAKAQGASTSFTHIDVMTGIGGERTAASAKGALLIGDSDGGDVLVGTSHDDVLIGDLPSFASVDLGITGGDDVLIGGLGSDILFGGLGNDIIDGGSGLDASRRAGQTERDIAVYQGDARDYSIAINGDGSYTVLDGRTDVGLSHPVFGVDGIDKVSNVEEYRFLNGNLTWLWALVHGKATPPPGQGISVDDLYHLPGHDQRLTGNVDLDGNPDTDPSGVETVVTPVGWGLTEDAAAHGQKVTDTPDETEKNPVSVQTGDGFAVGWQVDNGDGTTSFKITMFDAVGEPKSLGDGPGTVIVATTGADGSVAGALGAIGDATAAAWAAKAEGEAKLELQLFDEDGLPIGTGSLTVTSGPEGTSYSDLSIATQSVPSGAGRFSIVWIQNPAPDGTGDIMVQGYSAPTEDSTDPVALGQDGDVRQESDYAPDEVPADVAGNDNNEPYKVGEGSSANATGLYGGDLGVVWVESKSGGSGSRVKGVVFSPDGEKLLNIDLSDYGRDGDIEGKPKLLEGLNGDIVVAWLKELDRDKGYVIEAVVYPPGDTGTWAKPTTEIALKYFDDDHDPKGFSITVLGGDTASLVVTWKMDGKVYGQQYDYSGQPMGGEFKVVGSSTGSLDQQNVVSLGDGRFVVTYLETQTNGSTDVGAQVLDPRSAEAPVVGDGSDGSYVGTVFDDIVDGQEAHDRIYGGLGNDVLVGGIGDDQLYGGAGDDHLIGGSGTDILLGDEGNDWLQGGHGRDYISGGAGIDTLSYTGEARGVIVDLQEGAVRSEADHNGALAGAGTPGLDPTVIDGKTYTTEDLLGTVDADGFHATHDIENVEGGLGNDTLRGDAGDNVLLGGKGDDILEGRGGNDVLDGGEGNDTVVYSGDMGEYEIKVDDRGTADFGDDILTITHLGGTQSDGTDTLTSIENFQFNGTIFARADLSLTLVGSNTNDVLAGGNGDDRLEGGAGDDLLSGGYGNDTFVFKPGFGSDVVLDFSNTPANDDTIEISSSLYSSYEAALEAHALTPDGHGNVIFALGDDTIVFKGLDIRTLDADDFKFI